MVNVNFEIEAADNALVFVAKHHLLADKLPHAAFPVPVKVCLFGIVGGETEPITEVFFLDLARKSKDGFTAVGASCLDFMPSPRLRYKPLPLAITFVVAASFANVLLGVLHSERFAAYGAAEGNVTALVVAVVFASVLVEIYISALLAGLLVAWNNFAATTGAVDNFGASIFKLSGHLLSPFRLAVNALLQDIIA